MRSWHADGGWKRAGAASKRHVCAAMLRPHGRLAVPQSYPLRSRMGSSQGLSGINHRC